MPVPKKVDIPAEAFDGMKVSKFAMEQVESEDEKALRLLKERLFLLLERTRRLGVRGHAGAGDRSFLLRRALEHSAQCSRKAVGAERLECDRDRGPRLRLWQELKVMSHGPVAPMVPNLSGEDAPLSGGWPPPRSQGLALVWLVFNVPIVWIFDPWTRSPASVESSGPLHRAKIIGVGSSSPAESSVECLVNTVYRTCPRKAFDVTISDAPISFRQTGHPATTIKHVTFVQSMKSVPVESDEQCGG